MFCNEGWEGGEAVGDFREPCPDCGTPGITDGDMTKGEVLTKEMIENAADIITGRKAEREAKLQRKRELLN